MKLIVFLLVLLVVVGCTTEVVEESEVETEDTADFYQEEQNDIQIEMEITPEVLTQ